MKTSRRAFCTGAILQIVTCPIHLLGHFQKKVPANDQERTLLDLLDNYKTDFGAGFVRSLGDIMSGLSLQYSIFMLMIGIISLLALRQGQGTPFLRTLCWINFAFMAICSVNAYFYFFLPPLMMFVLPAIAYLMAGLSLTKEVEGQG